MTRQLLFVQGGGGANAHDAWDSKLVDSLERELGSDFEIRYPRMPDEDSPKFARWNAVLRKELDELDNGAILVGHSIGAAILAHSLAEEPLELAPAGIFLISMPFIGEGGWSSDDIKPKPNLGTKLPEQSPVYLYQSGDDETVPVEHAELNAKAIPQAVVRKIAGRDHQLDNDMSEVAADIRELGKPRRPSARIDLSRSAVSEEPAYKANEKGRRLSKNRRPNEPKKGGDMAQGSLKESFSDKGFSQSKQEPKKVSVTKKQF